MIYIIKIPRKLTEIMKTTSADCRMIDLPREEMDNRYIVDTATSLLLGTHGVILSTENLME